MISWDYFILAIFVNSGYLGAFNIDLNNIVTMKGSPDSYFGYSVGIASSTSKWVFVGSPRANDSTMPNVHEPGGVYRCPVSGPTPTVQCEQIQIDSKTGSDKNIFNRNFQQFTHGKDGQWLGGTLAVPANTDKGIVACAHRWYNREFEKSKEMYMMNGLCYIIPLDLTLSNIAKLTPMIYGNNQTATTAWGKPIFNYGMANMGMSAHFTKSDTNILLGTPGKQAETGGFVDITNTVTGLVMESNKNDINTTESQYLGYSSTSGKYFADGKTYYVFGAPRAHLIGKIVFFDSLKTPYVLKEASKEMYGDGGRNESLPMNSFYGATLCTADVNADGVHDLLVGAPLYSTLSSDGFVDKVNVGRVFLYLGSREKTSNGFKDVLVFSGEESSGAQFGLAIASLGDINKDNYDDIAIGAPYEDEMRGVVYVYNGYKEGLWAMFSQRISARQLDTQLRGFGVAISKAADVNGDKINDVAIGAYLSNTVILLYGQSVITMTMASMRVSEKSIEQHIIDKRSKDISVKLCFRYVSGQCLSLTINATIKLDTDYVDQSRLVFSKTNLPGILLTVSLFSGDLGCSSTDDGLITVRSTADLVTPIKVVAEYDAGQINCDQKVHSTLNRFDGANPSDPLLVIQKELEFKKDCPNNHCRTDLHLMAETEHANKDGYFVVGTLIMNVKVKIAKNGDPSYGSTFQIKFPEYLLYRRMTKVAGDTEISCSLVAKTNNGDDEKTASDQMSTISGKLQAGKGESMITCSFGNPMYNDSGVEFVLMLQVPNMISETLMMFHLQASTLSTEINSSDNNQTLVTNIRSHVEGMLTGKSEPGTIFVHKTTETYDMSHVYQMENKGPSNLRKASFNIYYPQSQEDNKVHLYLNQTQLRCYYPCELKCEFTSIAVVPPVFVFYNGRMMSSHQNSSKHTKFTSIKHLDCAKEDCSLYTCAINNLPQGGIAVVHLDFVIHKDIEGIAKGSKHVKFVSKASVKLEGMDLIGSKMKFDEQLTTDMMDKVPQKKEANWWIIVLSIISGIIIIVIMVLIMWKCGFFKREKRDEMTRLKQEDEEPKEKEANSVKDKDSYTDSENGIIDKETQPAKE